MSTLDLDDIKSAEWEINEDGGGEATLLVRPSAGKQGGQYQFEHLTELPDLMEAITLDEGSPSGQWSGR